MLPSLKTRDVSPRTLLIFLLLAITGYYILLARDSYMRDFRAYYVAAKISHAGLDPYLNHADLTEQYADGTWDRVDSRFIYPPTALFALAPFAHLSYERAKVVFGFLICVSLLASLLTLYRRYPVSPLIPLALLLTLPVFFNLETGQADCFILMLTLIAFWAGDTLLGGASLGFAIALKFSPALTLLWFAGTRRWKTILGAVIVDALLGGLAYMKWGALYFREFAHNMLHHHEPGHPMLNHVFTTIAKIKLRYITTTDGLFSFQHDVISFYQNPLGVKTLGHIGGPIIVLCFSAWLLLSKRGRALRPERSFFLFLTVALLANHLLWPMGLVMCFPLVFVCVQDSPTQNLTAILLLLPLFITKFFIGDYNYTLFLVMAAFTVWQSRWFRQPVTEPA